MHVAHDHLAPVRDPLYPRRPGIAGRGDGGATYVLTLAAVLSVGTLVARSRVGPHWLLVGTLVSTAGFVLWQGSSSTVNEGAPVYRWLLLAGIALTGALLPALGPGYLLATPVDAAG